MTAGERAPHWEGFDPEGFTSLAQLKHTANTISSEAFCERYPDPSLLILGAESEETSSTPIGFTTRRTVDELGGRAESSGYHGKIVFLKKRPNNPFPNMISVGRAPNSDIVFRVSSVSKLHGYFMRLGDEWKLCDHGSTNGSFLNGDRLKGRELETLRDGDRIDFSKDVRCEFYTARTLYLVLTDVVGVRWTR